MKKSYRIDILPEQMTWKKIKNIDSFLTEISEIDGAEISDNALAFTCDSQYKEILISLAEKYSIVNLNIVV